MFLSDHSWYISSWYMRHFDSISENETMSHNVIGALDFIVGKDECLGSIFSSVTLAPIVFSNGHLSSIIELLSTMGTFFCFKSMLPFSPTTAAQKARENENTNQDPIDSVALRITTKHIKWLSWCRMLYFLNILLGSLKQCRIPHNNTGHSFCQCDLMTQCAQ